MKSLFLLSSAVTLALSSTTAYGQETGTGNWKFENEAACVTFFTENPAIKKVNDKKINEVSEKKTGRVGNYINSEIKEPSFFCKMLSPFLVAQPTEEIIVSAGQIIEFSDTPKFYASLSASLKKFGGKETVTVFVKDDPNFTEQSLTGPLKSPDYLYYPAGISAWMERVKAKKGKVVFVDTSASFLSAGVDIFVPFIFKEVLPALFKSLFKQDPYKAASKVDIKVTRVPLGAALQAGLVTQIEFVPRGQRK
jgi:hypothetical protein